MYVVVFALKIDFNFLIEKKERIFFWDTLDQCNVESCFKFFVVGGNPFKVSQSFLQEKHRAKVKEKIDKCVKEKLLDFCDVLNIPINKAVVKKVRK